MGDRLATIEMGRTWGAYVPISGVDRSPYNTGLGLPPYQQASSSIQSFGHGPKSVGGGAVPLLWGTGSPSNIMSPGPRPTSLPSGIFIIHPAVRPQQIGRKLWGGAESPSKTMSQWHLNPSSRLATTDMGKNWGLCPFWNGGARSPSNTMWHGARPISVSSFILIHPTVLPQYANVTDRQDNAAIAQDELVLQRVAASQHINDH